MDLVAWDQAAFAAVAADIATLADQVHADPPCVIPVSALNGDNVAAPSIQAPWYGGPTVLQALEQATAGAWAMGSGTW